MAIPSLFVLKIQMIPIPAYPNWRQISLALPESSSYAFLISFNVIMSCTGVQAQEKTVYLSITLGRKLSEGMYLVSVTVQSFVLTEFKLKRLEQIGMF